MCSRSFRNANASASVRFNEEEELKEEEEVLLLDIVMLYFERSMMMMMRIDESEEEKKFCCVFLLHAWHERVLILKRRQTKNFFVQNFIHIEKRTTVKRRRKRL